MKKAGWIVSVVFLVLVGILVHTGGLGSRTSAATEASPVGAAVVSGNADHLHSPASWSYRHHQSTSWRSSLLQQ